MKSRILLLSILSLLIFSCKSDDESSVSKGKLVSHIDWDLGEYIDFTYQDDQKVKSIDITDDIILYFQYTNNQIETLIFQWGSAGGADVYRYNYDENNRITSFTFEDFIYDVFYNAAENSYSYTRDNDDVVKVFVNENDVEKLIINKVNGDVWQYVYDYAAENHGALANSNAVNLHILLAFPDSLVAFIVTAFTQKPIQSYNFDGEIFEFENTFDGDGFIIQRIFNDFNDELSTDTFEYSQP